MRAILVISTILSLQTTAYCFFEYQMPHAQFSKVLSHVEQAGITDPEVLSRIRWSIVGVQTTWKPLLVITSVQSVLTLALTIYAFTGRRMPGKMG
jgi:hypothetical protein